MKKRRRSGHLALGQEQLSARSDGESEADNRVLEGPKTELR